MKKPVLLVCLVLLCSGSAWAGEAMKISAPPSIWIQEEGGRLTGGVMDLLEDLFSRHGITVESEKLPWARAIADMKTGRLDMIPVIFHTEERTRFMAYSVPYVQVPTSVFVKKGQGFEFLKLEDLKGRRGVIIRNDSISAEFAALAPELDLTEISNYEQLFKMLVSDRADYAVAAKYGFQIEAIRLGYIERLAPLPKPVASRGLHCAFSKKSKFIEYLPVLNHKLEDMKADGSVDRLILKAIREAASSITRFHIGQTPAASSCYHQYPTATGRTSVVRAEYWPVRAELR